MCIRDRFVAGLVGGMGIVEIKDSLLAGLGGNGEMCIRDSSNPESLHPTEWDNNYFFLHFERLDCHSRRKVDGIKTYQSRSVL